MIQPDGSQTAEQRPDGQSRTEEVGPPLATETLGALTLGGYIREICQRYQPNEALVFRDGDAVIRRTYGELWREIETVARALMARGITKESRVGLLGSAFSSCRGAIRCGDRSASRGTHAGAFLAS